MDYGFAPRKDRTGQLDRVRRMFKLRQNTTLLHNPKLLATLHDFLFELKTSSSVTTPVGDLLVGAHAHRSGVLDLSLDKGFAHDTEFEDLEDAIKKSPNPIKIPDSVIGYPSTTAHYVHIKGCNIGKAKPFLVKLCTALGGHVHVTAPKHFHGLTQIGKTGVFEWMAYEFVVSRKSRIKKKKDLIKAFRAATGMATIDGKPVPSAQWAVWMKNIPSTITKTVKPKVSAPLGLKVAGRKTIPTMLRLKVESPDKSDPLVPYTVTFLAKADVPKTKAGRRKELRDRLRVDPVNDPNHPFPMYRRFGYSSFADFFDDFVWDVSAKPIYLKKSAAYGLPCWGGRYDYTLQVPITDPTTDLDPSKGTLIFNFYPEPGVTSPVATPGLVETDARFFETV
jgi:hypothetical protein